VDERRGVDPVSLGEGEDRRVRIAVAATGLLAVALLVLIGLLLPATPPAADGGIDGSFLEVHATDVPAP
jgi:hypothetical protein